MDRRAFNTLLLSLPFAGAGTALAADAISVRIDYQAAEAMLAAMEKTSITEAEIDRLMALPGLLAMVDNTTKYIPESTRQAFRTALRQYVETRNPTVGRFALKRVEANAADARKAMAAMKADPNLIEKVLAPLNRYRPDTGPLSVTVYCVVGGASDGFVPDNYPEPAFFMAMEVSKGDVDGVRLNMTHELYHVAQRAARARVPGLSARVFDLATAPSPVRLLTVVLEEGTANYVADATKMPGDGPYIQLWRDQYLKNAEPKKIVDNFAVVDRLVAGLTGGSMTWEEAQKVVFTGYGPPPYFVGYEMAKAIDARWGPRRIGGYFQQHPAAFFQDYVALYRTHGAAVPARFAPATEAYLASLPRS
jgi:uncharacterized protein (DUF779 family)